ncbi:MC2R [Mytilus edulis]|uniref:MC2R n=1 Tax=Mytilus edulis TaxID=6550 RepID=A0A8S3PV54_MYTED|nr:MC2R [Mytilus edulis]
MSNQLLTHLITVLLRKKLFLRRIRKACKRPSTLNKMSNQLMAHLRTLLLRKKLFIKQIIRKACKRPATLKHNEQSAIGTSAHFVAQEEADCYTTKRERLSSLKTEKALSLLRGWECRAITTAGYVIGSTLVLRGPMVLCMVFDAFGIQYDNAIRDITAILVALQCLIDPFVYAFRFQAIRKEIQKMICCKKEVTTSNIYIY